MRLVLNSIYGVIIALITPFLLLSQIPDPVQFEIISIPKQVKAGEVFDIQIKTTIEGAWHLYSVDNAPDAGPVQTKFSSLSPNVAIAGKVVESKPEIQFDPNFNTELGWHSTKADFKVPVALNPDLSGEQFIELRVRYQVCDDRVCLPPKNKTIATSVSLVGVSDSPFTNFGEEEIPSSPIIPEETQIEQAPVYGSFSSDSIFSFIWIAITAGFAALLTPCVFPMIPLTVSFFSKQPENQGGKKPIGKVLGFGFSIVATFTILGALLSLFLGVSGVNNFASNPWVNLMIGLILLLFGFSLLGMYEIQLPYQLTNWLNRKSSESSGMIGVLFMALTISAVSFSCTAPFVGGVLAATAGGEWFYPIIGMVGFSAAFASPFVFFAMFPTLMQSLPKSGSWMNVVKVLLGFVELAAALKFISNADLVWDWGIVSRPLTIAAWIAIFMLAGFYVLGMFALKHEKKPETIGPGRLLLSMPFLLFSFYLIPGLLGASLGIWDAWLPPKQVTDVSVVASVNAFSGSNRISEEESWMDDYEESKKVALSESKPIFIDFTGYTCTNCRAMESTVFPLTEIQERFNKLIKVRLYTDDGTNGEKHQKFQFELTGTVALPTYVIVDSNSGRVINQLVGYSKKDEFLAFLDKGLNRFSGIK